MDHAHFANRVIVLQAKGIRYVKDPFYFYSTKLVHSVVMEYTKMCVL